MNFNPTLAVRRLEAIPTKDALLFAAAAIAATGVIDHFTGPVVSLAIIYLVPVAAAAWVTGPRPAYLLATLAAITWAVADRIGPLAEPKARLAYLNDLSMFALFAIVVAVIGMLRRQVRRQRDLLQQVQRHLLPTTLASTSGVELAARWIPAWTVAGDYYDAIDLGGGRLAICLADVSGKGVTAALIMSNVQAIVRTAAAERRHAPDRLLGTLNQLLHERLAGGFFVTVFYAVIDTRAHTLSFANAGHPPAMLRRRDGTVVRLESTGPVAGILPGATYRCVEVPLGAGDQIVVYSDGVTESEDRAGEEFGVGRLEALLSASCAAAAEETCAGIAAALHHYGGGRPFHDDVTMLVARMGRTAMSLVQDAVHEGDGDRSLADG